MSALGPSAASRQSDPSKVYTWASKGVAEPDMVSVFISMIAAVYPSGLSLNSAGHEPHFLGQRPFPETESQQFYSVVNQKQVCLMAAYPWQLVVS